ncbi:MAG TPA: 30S ribosomal protein S11 [Candidatus Ratteibacteria bacterium]|nr:30S ribosomal protein S11 [bacterium]HRR95665.1 30S ribosomal protein S11 [Candidatus Ratteibacteria bacterium]
MAARKYVKKRKKRVSIERGIVHIKATFNNTIVTLTDLEGKVLLWASAGSIGFKGTRKGTPFAAQLVSENVAKRAINMFNMKEVSVFVKGPGPGRETAIRALQSTGLNVVSIKDVTPIPHDGCRPPKRRRV